MAKNKNKENNIVVPDSPSELWKEWSNFQQSKCSFAEELEGSLFNEETGEGPDLEEVTELVERLLVRMRNLHFNTLQDDELLPIQRKLWKDDLKHLDKALKSVRAMN